MASQQETTLQELVEGKLFVVPDYQRPYAWDQKQLTDLWDDLDLMGQGRHYTGTLVLLKRPESTFTTDDESLTEWEVVDGQQRLTTTLLLLDRLRRCLDAVDHETARVLAGSLRTSYGEITVAWEPRARIQLGGDLNSYWHNSILNDRPASLAGFQSGHRLLKQAADHFDMAIADLVSDDRQATVDRLSDLADRVTSGLRFLVYEVSSAADVGVIFETLNDRGRGLTELEKIKNYLLYLARQMPASARDSLVDHINHAWAAIFDNFAAAPGVNEDAVLRAHWIATQDGDARRWKGTQSVKAKFPRSNYVPDTERLLPRTSIISQDPWQSLRTDIVGYVDTLQLCSLYARELASAQPQFVDFVDHREEARQAEEVLRSARLGVVRFYPIIFGARLAHPTDGGMYTEIIRLCETFTVRVLLLAQWRSHTGRSSLNRLGRDIFTGKENPASAISRFAGTIRYYADDDAVARHLAQPDNWYGRNGHKFLLYEYERSLLRPGASISALGAFLDKGYKETTEHILPQTPSRNSQWRRDFTPDERKVLTNTLGNLMLTMDNSRYSNRDFVNKRGTTDAPADAATYYNGLRQERKVAQDFDQWTPGDIRMRQAHLAEWILQRWSVPGAGNALAEPTADDIAHDIVEDEEQAMTDDTEQEIA